MASQEAPSEELPIIFAYTREQAIEDGVLVDLTEWGSAEKGFHGGFTCPVAVTSALWAAIQAIPESKKGLQDIRGRAHDVLFLSSLAVHGALSRHKDRAEFALDMPVRGQRRRLQILNVVADGDGITIGFPEDF